MLSSPTLPEVNIDRLPNQIVVGERLADDYFAETTIKCFGDVTVGELKRAVAIRQLEIQHAGEGYTNLQNLLNRRLLQGAQDSDLALLDPGDDEYRARVHEHIGREAKRFHELMENFDFGTHVDVSLRAGRLAYKAATPTDQEGECWAVIELDRKSKPLIFALRMCGVGDLDPGSLCYTIGVADILHAHFKSGKAMSHSLVVQQATIEAFALDLSKPGFEIAIHRRSGSSPTCGSATSP